MAIDLNRGSAGVADLLPREISQEIWGNAVEESLVMQAGRQINIPGSGISIPIITGEPQAQWVAETDAKPVDNHTVSSKVLTPYKMAIIEPFSDEFRRDLPGLYAELARRLPKALGRLFDQTVLGSVAPGSGFDVLGGSASVAVDGTDTIDDLANVLSTVAAAGGDLSHWLISPQLEGRVMTAKDGAGQYAFLRDARTDSGAVGSIFGRDVLRSSSVRNGAAVPPVDGIAGDFANSAIWGTVEGIKVDISDQATIVKNGTPIHLWAQNMFAIRAEVELGFIVRDAAHFVKLTEDAGV